MTPCILYKSFNIIFMKYVNSIVFSSSDQMVREVEIVPGMLLDNWQWSKVVGNQKRLVIFLEWSTQRWDASSVYARTMSIVLFLSEQGNSIWKVRSHNAIFHQI